LRFSDPQSILFQVVSEVEVVEGVLSSGLSMQLAIPPSPGQHDGFGPHFSAEGVDEEVKRVEFWYSHSHSESLRLQCPVLRTQLAVIQTGAGPSNPQQEQRY
jgi:hypothetical protein